MTNIVYSNYRPKRAPRKRKPRTYPADLPTIITIKPMKRRVSAAAIKIPVPVIVEPKRKPNTMLAHLLEDATPEEHRRRVELADELFRTVVRRASKSD